jgi:sterol desaturase/sphingolipid hydroxylase (fatty acid hydroxylase superfamily)
VVLPLWDILFGTFIDPAASPVKAAGIKGDPIPHRFLVELASPFNVSRWK